MKWQCCSKLSIAIGFSLFSFSAWSMQTIYGLQQSRHLKGTGAEDYYIQTGSYSSKSNALRAQSEMKRKSSHPVLLKQKNGYYAVMVGPFHSATEVRMAAQKFGATPSVVAQKKTTATSSHNPGNISPIIPVLYKDKDGVSPENHWFVGMGGGWLAPFGTDATNFATSGIPGFPDDRYLNNGSGNTGQISAFAGYQWRRSSLYFPAVSLSFEYTYTFPANIHGVIFVNDLPDTRNFTYKYEVSQQLPMAKLKLNLYQWKQFMPYVSGGLGVAVNRASDYSDSPIPGATVMGRRFGFNPGNTTQLAGSLGVGFDYWYNYHCQITLGYELAYYGKARTGYGQEILSASRLGGNFNSNSLVIKGTYFLG